jgi:hypothetical protein
MGITPAGSAEMCFHLPAAESQEFNKGSLFVDLTIWRVVSKPSMISWWRF